MATHQTAGDRFSCVYYIYMEYAVFAKDGVEEILNLQPKGSQAKAYQVRQIREVILKHQLGGANDASL
ncbi:hypothetical protein QUB36_10030 [Microcoleus sp. AT8-B1]|uniref:hypothetical protein n=1 Tax=unclassified Microcoleus TaxID=2642155 RepID=UPI002FD54533